MATAAPVHAPLEPISALALQAAAEPPPAAVPTVPRILFEQLRPLAAHGVLFALALMGGLAVATAASVTLRYVGDRADAQIAAARISVRPAPLEPLDVEIRKAKAELDAAVSAQNGS